MTIDLPIVDLSPLKSGSDEDLDRVAAELRGACQASGFACLINSRVTAEDISEIFSLGKEFFALPMGTKQEVLRPKEPGYQRGYIPPHDEEASGLTPLLYNEKELKALGKLGPEIRESFQACAEDQEDTPFPNLWLAEEKLPGFRARWEHFMKLFGELQLEVIDMIERSFPDMPSGSLVRLTSKQNFNLRVAKYLAGNFDEFSSRDKAWLAPHTDIGIFTFTAADAPGLEVEIPGQRGAFMPVNVPPGAIILNVADSLERLTNDQFKSTVHRVNPPPPKDGEAVMERYSLILFSNVDRATIMDPLPGTWSKSAPKLYEPITFEQWETKRFNLLVRL